MIQEREQYIKTSIEKAKAVGNRSIDEIMGEILGSSTITEEKKKE